VREVQTDGAFGTMLGKMKSKGLFSQRAFSFPPRSSLVRGPKMLPLIRRVASLAAGVPTSGGSIGLQKLLTSDRRAGGQTLVGATK